jgi:hypothetical protein
MVAVHQAGRLHFGYDPRGRAAGSAEQHGDLFKRELDAHAPGPVRAGHHC